MDARIFWLLEAKNFLLSPPACPSPSAVAAVRSGFRLAACPFFARFSSLIFPFLNRESTAHGPPGLPPRFPRAIFPLPWLQPPKQRLHLSEPSPPISAGDARASRPVARQSSHTEAGKSGFKCRIHRPWCAAPSPSAAAPAAPAAPAVAAPGTCLAADSRPKSSRLERPQHYLDLTKRGQIAIDSLPVRSTPKAPITRCRCTPSLVQEKVFLCAMVPS